MRIAEMKTRSSGGVGEENGVKFEVLERTWV